MQKIGANRSGRGGRRPHRSTFFESATVCAHNAEAYPGFNNIWGLAGADVGIFKRRPESWGQGRSRGDEKPQKLTQNVKLMKISAYTLYLLNLEFSAENGKICSSI